MFKEKSGEKEGQRRKRFLLYLRELPHPLIQWVPSLGKFVPKK